MKHILLVDDEPEILEGLALILQPIPDVMIHTACFASQALQVMDQQEIVLVIADIRMPGMNGIEMWEQIQRRAPQCRVIFLSGVRDFDNIYRVIQSPGARFLTKMEPEEKILAAVEEVLNEVESQQQKRLEERLAILANQLMASSGKEAPTGELTDLLKDQAFVLLTSVPHWAMSAAEKKTALQAFFDEIRRSCNDGKPLFLSLHEAYALCLLPQREVPMTEDHLLKVVQHVCQTLWDQSGLSYRCTYGICAVSVEKLHDVYRAFLQWRSREHVPETCILPASALRCSAQPMGEREKLNPNLRTLQGYIKLGQHEGFRQLTSRMCQEAQKSKDASCLLDTYYSILALLCQQMDASRDPALHEAIRRECRRSLAGKDAMKDVQERLDSYVDQVFAQLFPADPYTHANVVESIQRYIRDHLSDDLSLTALSHRFAMNPSYLSRIFRENSGDRLHEYIASLRMSYAAQMLSSSSMRVNEIAKKAGYDTVHTFIRSFRKQFGCTPLEYRLRHGGNSSG